MKKTNKVIAAVLAMCMCGAYTFYSVSAETEIKTYKDDKNVTYEYIEKDDAIDIKTIRAEKELSAEPLREIDIPSQIDGKDVTTVESAYFEVNRYINTIVFPDTVTTISQIGSDGSLIGGTCSDMQQLEKVVLPKGLINLGPESFADCKMLQYINIPETLKVIPQSCFRGCSLLAKIDIPDTITEIAAGAFHNCSALENIHIPNNIDTLGKEAFTSCTSLSNVDWNKCVSTPGENIFINTPYQDTQKNKCLLLNNDTYLESYTGSADFVIPDSVKELARFSFEFSTAKKITLTSAFDYVPDNLFSYEKELTEVVFKGKIDYIGEAAFFQCESLKELDIPKGTSKISDNAFKECTGLEKVTFPDGIESIGDNAFKGCKKLSGITFPKTLQKIGNYAFYDCESLSEVELPYKLKELGVDAFRRCTALTAVTLPASVVNVDAFMGCLQIAKVTVTNGTIDFSELYDRFKDTAWGKAHKVKSKTGFNIVGNILTEYDGDSKAPIIPSNVTAIGSRAFLEKDIDTVTIPSSVTKISTGAFMRSKIKEIIIPGSIKEIEAQTFGDCKELTSVTLEEGVEKICTSAFEGCENLAVDKVKIPSSTKVDYEAFNSTPLDTGWVKGSDTATPQPTQTASPAPQASAKPRMNVTSDDGNIDIKVNEKNVSFTDAKPFVDANDRTQIPIRAVAEMLGAKVSWDNTNYEATIEKDGTKVVIPIGKKEITKNGETISMDTEAIIVNERTYIPARSIAEALGYDVSYAKQ